MHIMLHLTAFHVLMITFRCIFNLTAVTVTCRPYFVTKSHSKLQGYIKGTTGSDACAVATR